MRTILIMSDEHNPKYSSPYGNKNIISPNMEYMARNGSTFMNCYCNSPLCMPSRSSFMTGKRVHELQTYSNCNVNVKSKFPTYGELLSNNGIKTFHIGKTDVYAPGDELGFTDIYENYDRKLPGDINFARNPLSVRADGKSRADGFGVRERAYEMDDPVTSRALEKIKEMASADEDYLMTVNYLSPHFPHYTSQDLWDLYEGIKDDDEFYEDSESASHPYAKDLKKHFQTEFFSKEQISGLRRGYFACISYLDRQIGTILKTLDELGILESTNIIYTSDHGEMLGKFGMWWKCSMYEDSVRVPCIAMGPAFACNKKIYTPADLTDVHATLFACFNLDKKYKLRGTPLQKIPAKNDDKTVFAEYHGHGTRSGSYMIRKGDYKLIFNMKAPHQLFNILNDPEELNNLYEKEQHIAVDLKNELYKICFPEKENVIAHRFQEEQLKLIETGEY